ncbi:MAG: hypothetical protein JW808_10230 [Victivallales bacterium]|nr:hypothetical protein [Victivallales bacterium]
MDSVSDKQSADGIRRQVPKELMPEHIRRYRDAYDIVPGAPLYRREFGFYCMDEWHKQGLAPDANLNELFVFDPPANHTLGCLGWCEAAFFPQFESKVIEDRGDCEVAQDSAGRHVLFFKGRRSGFMPEYLTHPVKDRETWENNVKWRLEPTSPERYADIEKRMEKSKAAASQGMMICANLIGGYMYLRSLIGPEDLLYKFYDTPDLIHDCMKTWLELADTVTARHQEHVSIDEVYFAEDICYNHGPLISPDMINKFIIPYYQQFIGNVKQRQIDRSRHIYVQIDTDGLADPVIPVYRKGIGMDVMSPFEVASGCDVVRTGKEFPDLVMSGGIDKRVLAQGKKQIDDMLRRIIPEMRRRGGYIPTCDHGVPAEVTLENYMHYRQRCIELGG